ERWSRDKVSTFEETEPCLAASNTSEASTSTKWYPFYLSSRFGLGFHVMCCCVTYHLKFTFVFIFLFSSGEVISFADDLLSGPGSSCIVAGKRHGDFGQPLIYSLIFKCLEPDSLYKFTLIALDSRGRRSESSFVSVRTSCPMVSDNKAEELAEKVYNLYNGYTSGKEQQTAYNTLMEISPSMLYRVQHHYNSLYEKFGDFVWRSEDELGPRKAHLILRRLDRVSRYCAALLRSAYIQSRTDTAPYLFCRSDEVRPPNTVWHGSLQDIKVTCEEKLMSVPRNIYGDSKLR
uniref:Astrotactin 2 n=1 Tax=Erpetoichthys calabaricus TaxID=27687 RepID=A0A8C4TG79_ERPCA